MSEHSSGCRSLLISLVTSALGTVIPGGVGPVWGSQARDREAELPRLAAQVGHSDAVTGVAFALGGRCNLTVGNEGSTRIQDTETGSLLRSIETPSGPNQGLDSIAVWPDDRSFLIGGDD